MIQNKKRLWALLLSAALIVTQLPAVAMAENNTPEDNVLKDGSIASFDSLDSSVANQTVDVGTEFSGLYLPNLVTASVYQVTKDMVISDEDSSNKDSTNEDSTDEDVTEVSNDISTASGVEGSVSAGNAGDSSGKDSGKAVTAITTSKGEIPVTWDSEPTYDGDIEGKYVFTADVGSYVLSGSAKLPQITVTVAGEILEKEEKIPSKEPFPCKQTEGCTLAGGHEGECVTGQLPAVKVLLGVAKSYGLNNTSEESGIKIVAGNNGEVEYTGDSGFTLKASGDYTIFGTWSGNLDAAVITVPGGVAANIMLKDVTINVNGLYRGAFAVEAGGTANITLSGTNTFTSGFNSAGLDVPENAEMTITHESTGELYVNGGGDSAGIGCSHKGSSRTAGKITINGGVVTAIGGNQGAGIGGSSRVSGGTIIINDGVVTAIGGGSGTGGSGIGGGGNGGNGGSITINGGTVIATGGNSISGGSGSGIGGGGGGMEGGSGGNITVNGGTVIATSGNNSGGGSGSGIGGGGRRTIDGDGGGNGGTVKISGASTKVTAAGGEGAFDVGGGGGGGRGGNGGGGSLSVVGGAMLEMKNTGTNAVNPEYKNCTIIDKAGKSVEYGINGLPISSPALLLEVSPKGSAALPNTVTLTATLSGAVPDNSGKKIKFTIGTTTHTVSTDSFGKASCTVLNLALGTYNFGASFDSDEDNYSASATEITGYIVVLGTQDVLSITGLDSAYTYGSKAFDLSTSGGSGTGAVNFVSSEPSIASVAGNTVTIQKAGTFTITAAKNGDSNYAETKVTSPAVTVHRATPNMSLTASGGSTTTDPLILTATVSKVGTGRTPAGTVTFKEGNTSLYSDSLDGDGKAVYTVSNPAAGSHTYTVEYSGQTGYYKNTSTTHTIGIGLPDQTGFVITAPGAKTYGDGDFTLTASGGQSTGTVSFSVRDGNGILTVSAAGKVKIIGAGKVTVTAVKNADSSYNQAMATLELTVAPRDISNITVSVTGSRVYTGSQLQPVFEVYDGNNAIAAGDYTNSYGANMDAGAGSITLTGERNYTGSKKVQFDIEKRPLDSAAITLESSSYTHTGSEIKPAVTNVTVDGIFVPAAEYDVGYADNKDVGTATVTITAKADGNFSGSVSTTFTIAKENIPSGGESSGNSSNNSVTNQIQQPTVDAPNPSTVGKITPSVTVNKDGKVTVSVSDGDIQSAIDRVVAQAKEDGTLANGIAVSIDLTGLKTQFNTLPLTLSRTVYQKLVDAGVEYLSVVTPQISLSLDLETLKTIYTNAIGNVTIRAVRAENRKLPAGMKNRPAYDLTIVSGGRQISDFGKGNIAITLPYTLKRTEQGGNLQMAYVDTEGKVQNMTHSSYNANQSVMIGRTNHFTVFGIVKKQVPAYKDIEGHWAKDDILFVASRKLLSGTGNNQFSPNTGMTRGMFVTALGRLSGIEPAQYKNTKFSDVAATAYYAPYVAWAAEKGIVNGVTDTTFVPDTNISREQMAVIMYNYAKTIGYTVPKTCEAVTFADNGSIESWAKEAVKAMQMAGVLNGKDGSNFDPKASATRAEVSAVLRRFVEIVIDPATAGGWVKNDSGHWLYYKDGKVLGGWQTIGKLRYYFNDDGVMHEGWKQDTNTNKWY